MSLRWIVAIIYVYLFGVGITSAIIESDEFEKDGCNIFIIAWPLFLPIFFGYIIVKKIVKKKK